MTQQERFEAWAAQPPRKWYIAKNDVGEYLNPYVETAWKAWQVACPEGWQAVPVEPTEEMIYSGKETMQYSLAMKPVFTTYKAMLSAAPNPEDV